MYPCVPQSRLVDGSSFCKACVVSQLPGLPVFVANWKLKLQKKCKTSPLAQPRGAESALGASAPRACAGGDFFIFGEDRKLQTKTGRTINAFAAILEASGTALCVSTCLSIWTRFFCTPIFGLPPWGRPHAQTQGLGWFGRLGKAISSEIPTTKKTPISIFSVSPLES